MNSDATPTIYSFIIRFVVDDATIVGGTQPAYHGAIRHIQSAEELSFNDWTEAVAFMRRFVPIENLNSRPDQVA
jgi:hypothetical protein